MSVASTTIHKSEHLWEYDEYYDTNNDENEYQSQRPDIMSDDDQSDTDQIEDRDEIRCIVKQIIQDTGSSEEIDLDEAIAFAAHARPRRNITAEHLSKVWRIDLDTAKRTADITSQHAAKDPDSKLSRSYATSDWMLRYKRIRGYWLMYTFFATKMIIKSLRRKRCYQLFVIV